MRTFGSIVVALAFAGAAAAEEIRVLAATTDLGAVAAAVGGDLVQVDAVARSDRDPHALEVRPSTIRKAAKADLYLAVGLSLDIWSDAVVRGSRNRDLEVVDCSQFIEPLEIPEGRVDRSMGDVHPEGNPHYWLDPERVILVAAGLAERFAKLDPDNAARFVEGAETVASTLRERMAGWADALEGVAFVEYHRSWVYFAERFGLRVVAQVEPFPGIPPTARQLTATASAIRSDGALLIVHEPYHPLSPVRFLERQTSAKGVLMRSSCAEPTWEALLDHFETIVSTLSAGQANDGGSPSTG